MNDLDACRRALMENLMDVDRRLTAAYAALASDHVRQLRKELLAHRGTIEKALHTLPAR